MPIGCQLGIAATKVGVAYARETQADAAIAN